MAEQRQSVSADTQRSQSIGASASIGMSIRNAVSSVWQRCNSLSYRSEEEMKTFMLFVVWAGLTTFAVLSALLVMGLLFYG